MTHTLAPLPYAYNALEPIMSEKTLRIHHGKHHQAYVDKLNAALAGRDALLKAPVEDLLKSLSKLPTEIQQAVRNFGGGHANHSFFWQCMKKDVAAEGTVLKKISEEFGSFEQFKEQFSQKAASLFGSGWTWLVLAKGKLEIVNTPNQDTPLSDGKIPLLVLDIWEHAYYIMHQWNRTK